MGPSPIFDVLVLTFAGWYINGEGTEQEPNDVGSGSFRSPSVFGPSQTVRGVEGLAESTSVCVSIQ